MFSQVSDCSTFVNNNDETDSFMINTPGRNPSGEDTSGRTPTEEDFIASFLRGEFQDCPRETFINRTLEMLKGDVTELEATRYSLLKKAKESKDVPYPDGILKRRMDRRVRSGDSIQKKIIKRLFLFISSMLWRIYG